MGRHIEKHGDFTHIEYDTLSDGSVAHNVLLQTDTKSVVLRFACGDKRRAVELADAMEKTVCWYEVV